MMGKCMNQLWYSRLCSK